MATKKKVKVKSKKLAPKPVNFNKAFKKIGKKAPVLIHSLRVEDSVLPTLQLENPCSIEIEISANRINLFIGPRDHAFAKTKNGWELIASGLEEDKPNVHLEEDLTSKVDSILGLDSGAEHQGPSRE